MKRYWLQKILCSDKHYYLFIQHLLKKIALIKRMELSQTPEFDALADAIFYYVFRLQ